MLEIAHEILLIIIILGTSNPPWGRSAEYLLLPVAMQLIAPPLQQILDMKCGTCPTIVSPFKTDTA